VYFVRKLDFLGLLILDVGSVNCFVSHISGYRDNCVMKFMGFRDNCVTKFLGFVTPM